MRIVEVSLLDYLTKKELSAEAAKKTRERCEVYRSAYAHMIRGGPAYKASLYILESWSSVLERGMFKCRPCT